MQLCWRRQTVISKDSGVAPPSRRQLPWGPPEIPIMTQAISRAFVTTAGDLLPQKPLNHEEVSRATHVH